MKEITVKQRKFIVNIGLNVGADNQCEQLERQLTKTRQVTKNYHNGKYFVKAGTYEHAPGKFVDEYTFAFEASVNPFAVRYIVEGWCNELQQDCIAVLDKEDNIGELVYRPGYTGYKQDFNPDYFTK